MARVTQEKNRPSWAIKEPHVPHLPLPSLFCLFSCAASWFGYDVAKSITASLLIGCLDTSRIARKTNFSLIVPFSSPGIAPNRRLCWCRRLSPLSLSGSVAWTMRRRNSSTTQHAVGVANRIVRYQPAKKRRNDMTKETDE